MQKSRNSSDQYHHQVKKVRIIACEPTQEKTLHQPTTPDNIHTVDNSVDDAFENNSISSATRKRKKLSSTIAPNQKPMSSLALAARATSTLFSQSSSSSPEPEPSSPSYQAGGVVERAVGIVKDSETMDPGAATISHGLISVIGRRRAMEDMVTAAPGFVHVNALDHVRVVETSFDFFGVFDGHGGSSVSQRCRERMHGLVAEEIEAEAERRRTRGETGLEWERVMGRSFARMDEEVGEDDVEADEGKPGSVGSTALVVVVGREEVVVANCGDCRAVLARGGAAYPLSRDHKPERPDEKDRVEAAGGNVVNWDCSRVLGVLSTSRSIGDQYLKPYVIAEPEITVHKRSVSDEFLIIASDGLWDVIPNEVACELVRKCFDGQVRSRKLWEHFSGNCAAASATLLAELAIARGSRDNISVIVIQLQHSPSSPSSSSSST